jgi:hypothetical protein
MCYRVPSESTGPWQMEICPWNAIDLIVNPNFKEVKEEWPLAWEAYFAGEGEAPNYKKLEELGYQLYLNRLVYAKKGGELDANLQPFLKPDWSYGEGKFAILELADDEGEYLVYRCTEKGDELVDFLYRSYEHMFLD